jgi:hypothetical protein
MVFRRQRRQHVDRGGVGFTRAGARLHRRVNRAVGAGSGIGPRRAQQEIAEHRRGAARLHSRGPLPVAHEHVHLMAPAHERLQHRRTDVSRAACQEHTHGWTGPR